MSECNEPVYSLPAVTELPKSRDSQEEIFDQHNVTDKAGTLSNTIETTEISDKKETGYKKIDVPYKKAKPQRKTITAKII